MGNKKLKTKKEFNFVDKDAERILSRYTDSRYSDLHVYAFYLMDRTKNQAFAVLLKDLMFSGKSPSTTSRTRALLQNKKGLYLPEGEKIIPDLNKPTLIEKLELIWKIIGL